jgi:DNA-binding MarR family transcriptional regulator
MAGEESELTLGVLNAVHNNSNITQRSVASALGVALGLTNSYVKRCVKKGFIKVQQAPSKRYAYYLTPQGFVEKSRLTAEYLTQGFLFFRQARDQCTDVFDSCVKKGWDQIVLHGLTDLAEIAVLCAANSNVKIIGIVDDSSSLDNFSGAPVVGSISDLDEFDAVLITDLGDPQSSYDKLIKLFSADCVLAPAILNIAKYDHSAEIEN